jgi:cation transport protein ChaC
MHWVFGYGSLIWRPDFPHSQRIPARLAGYARRFWQGSPDHRGYPDRPGRVVTLTPMAGEECPGVIFGIEPPDVDAVIAILDIRESGGYSRTTAPVITRDGETVEATVYVGLPENPSYLGPDTIEAMARHIAGAEGPSGPNLDYLLQLRAALAKLGHRDRHIEELVAHLPPEVRP